MWHPDVKNAWGEKVTLNEGQRYLWECWQHLYQEAKKEYKPDVLVINGDLIDGEGRISAGSEQLTTMLVAQQKSAIKAIEPFVDLVDEVYVVRGTPYHDGKIGVDVEAIASAIGARGERGNKDWHSHQVLDLDVDGVIINFSHEIAVASSLYRATPHDRESVWGAMAGMTNKAPFAKCMVRSHAHYYIHIEHPRAHVVGTPCWQLQTAYMERKSPYRMMPDLGAVYIEIDHDAHKEGEDPINVVKRLYKLPPRKAIKSGVKADEAE